MPSRLPLALALILALSVFAAAQSSFVVNPTTTLAAESGNNTSTASLFTATSNGNLGPGNVSKLNTKTLLYPGFNGKIFVHLMGWFCMQSGSTATGAGTSCNNHVQVGYNSADPAVVKAQVTDMVSRGLDGAIHDWYGPGNLIDNESKALMAEAPLHPGFMFAIMIDKGAIQWNSCINSGCTATQALTQLAQYVASTYFSSPSYYRINGRPVITNFDIDLHYTVDWNYVAANTPGNPIFLFQNNGGFTHVLSGGSYSWVMPTDSNYGLDYLGSFYSTGMNYPAELTVGATYKGFNDTLASWSGNRIMDQQCGQTWLETFGKINSMYNSSNPLGAIQLVTWDDYEEGTAVEMGIDNCVKVTGSVSGTVLNWAISGDESTIDHTTVFISSDGQNLMPLSDFGAGVHQVDLASFSIGSGPYTLYVKATGKPSLRNQMSAAIQYPGGSNTTTAAVTITTPTNGATVGTPVHIVASAVSPNPVSSMIIYVDSQDAYLTYSSSLDTYLAMSPGSHTILVKSWDNTGAITRAQVVVTVASAPTASLALSTTSGIAPVTVTASTAGSTDPNAGATMTSTINWGDGTTTTGATGSHTYNSAGTYTVTATLSDNFGLTSSATQVVQVSPAAVTITSPANGAVVTSPVHVMANAVSGRPVTSMIIYVDSQDAYLVYASSLDTYLPIGPGAHTILVKSWDNTGVITQSQVAVTVDGGPTAALSVSMNGATATASTAASTDPYAAITSSAINWGDGTSSSGTSVSHTYATGGTYTITATVTDALGMTASQSTTVTAAGVVIWLPRQGGTSGSPVHVAATAYDSRKIASMIVYLDNNQVYLTMSNNLDTWLSMRSGTHRLVIKAWEDVSGVVYQSNVTFKVQ